MKRIYYLLISIASIVYCELVVIDCTFPCINSNEICQVNDQTIQCTEQTNNSKWVLQSATTLPVYQLTEIGLGQTCETAPQPNLISSTTTNNTQSTIEWPMNGYDSYYSNCAKNLYCDKANVCVKQIEHGQVCESSHQCLNAECINNTCSATPLSSSDNNTTGFTTVHIIIVVVGSILFVAVVIGLLLYYRKKKGQPVQTEKLDQTTSSTTSLQINILDPHYEPNFVLDNTPTIQQQQLQYQLQRQLNEIKSPPPYSP